MTVIRRAEVLDLEIEDFAFGGKGIARLKLEEGDYIIFVDNAFPGQRVRVRISKKRRKYAEAKLLEVLERSPKEEISKFQEISGAPYIFVPIKIQEEMKRTSTLDVLRKIGGIKNVESLFDEFISSPEHYFYRNKMEYSFSSIEHDLQTSKEIDDAFALGFKRRGTWWKVESLNEPSGLFDLELESKLFNLREFLKSTGLPAWHPPKKTGFFRHLVVRKSFDQDKLLINLVTSSDGIKKFNREAFKNFMIDKLGGRLAGLQHTVNDNVADRAKIENGDSILLYGEGIVVERLLGLSFEISMESFFQTNPKSAERLYTKALEYVFEEDLEESDIVMDLFCGTGTIGQILASKMKGVKIVGVDIVEEAIKDARKNAERNGIQGIEFYSSDVGKFLLQYPNFEGKIKTIILDPPRAGIAPKTLRKVIALGAKNIVYISCNPSTQARDTAQLRDAGYDLEKISIVDQFPHTGHVESIAKYKLK